MPIEKAGKKYKELFCKNDDCMKLLGYVSKLDAKPGVIILIICPRCGNENEWRFGYSELEEQFDKVKDVIERG